MRKPLALPSAQLPPAIPASGEALGTATAALASMVWTVNTGAFRGAAKGLPSA